MNDNWISIGEVIRYHRSRLGITQDKLSEDICSKRYLSKIEKGLCTPTIIIVQALSERMGIDLFEDYTEIIKHNDLETHKVIIETNEYLFPDKIQYLKPYIEKASTMKGFSYGEPLQILQYMKALYSATINHDYAQAILDALTALDENIVIANKLTHLSNIEFSLLLSLAVNYHRVGKDDSSLLYFNYLYTCWESISSKDQYSFNLKNHFELNIIGKTMYLYYTIFPSRFEEQPDLLINVISSLKKYQCALNLPELLMCYSSVCLKNGLSEDAQAAKDDAIMLCNIMNGKKRTERLIEIFNSLK